MKKFIIVLGALLSVSFILCACTSNYEDIKKTYDEAGYKISTILVNSDIAEMQSEIDGFRLEKVDKMFYAVKDNGNIPNGSRVDVISFNDGKEATAFYNSQKESEQSRSNFRVVKKGNIVIYGTEEAVEIVK